MNKNELFNKLLKRIEKVLTEDINDYEKLRKICSLLKKEVDYYDWVGFYVVAPDSSNELILGPFEGEDTEHKKIKFGQGICGQAAETKKVFVVQDVSKETNYLSCSPDVKSEIVLPVFKNYKIVAELDIDSYQLSPFTEEDQEFLKKVCNFVSELDVDGFIRKERRF